MVNKISTIKKEILKRQTPLWNETVSAAGPRYTKEFNIDVDIQSVFEGVGKTKLIFDEIRELEKSLEDSFSYLGKKRDFANPLIRMKLLRIEFLKPRLLFVAKKLGSSPEKDLDLIGPLFYCDRILDYIHAIVNEIGDVERKEEEAHREKLKAEGKEYFGHSASQALQKLRTLENSLQKIRSSVFDLRTFLKSNKARLFNDPFLLILGEAGMGKTHLVCDIAKQRIEKDLPPTEDAYLQAQLEKPEVYIIAASDGEEMVGGLVGYEFALPSKKEKELYLYDLAVDENYRRQGIASSLVGELKVCAKKNGVTLIFVEAETKDDEAVSFYRSQGAEHMSVEHFNMTL